MPCHRVAALEVAVSACPNPFSIAVNVLAVGAHICANTVTVVCFVAIWALHCWAFICPLIWLVIHAFFTECACH